MTWPFENDTSAITKKIAKNDIDKNRVKKVFSLTTIVFATALLMMLIMFESGYETTKDRMAEGQPQVVFYDLSQQQIELLYSEENIESIKVTETENGYDASITIVDATKMTQYGFSSAVDNKKARIRYASIHRYDLETNRKNGTMRKLCTGCREPDTYSDIGNYFRADIDKRLDKCRDFLFVIYISINIVYCILHCGSSDYFDDYYFRFLQFTKNSVG